MAFDLVPKSFWSFPSLRWPSWMDEDEDWGMTAYVPSGLTISEDDTHVYVEAAVPGLDPKDIDVTFNKGVLWVRGQAKEEEKKKKYHRKSERSVSYRVLVPGDIDEKKDPDANCKNGVMTVTFTKRPEVKPKKISVKG